MKKETQKQKETQKPFFGRFFEHREDAKVKTGVRAGKPDVVMPPPSDP